MSGGPTSAREAALKVILDELYPLMTRIEEVSETLGKTREELHADLKRLGELVETGTADVGDLISGARKLRDTLDQVKTVEVARSVAQPAPGRGRGNAEPSPNKLGLALLVLGGALVAALVGATCVGGSLYLMGGRDLIEQARLGQALQRAWPALDESTRKRVDQALQAGK